MSGLFIYLVVHVEFCGVHTWRNGTRCRDGVKVLCRSHLICLFFEGSIPKCTRFCSENFFVTCFCCFFLGIVKEKRGGRGGQGDAWSVK